MERRILYIKPNTFTEDGLEVFIICDQTHLVNIDRNNSVHYYLDNLWWNDN